jgi:hypothetical protein
MTEIFPRTLLDIVAHTIPQTTHETEFSPLTTPAALIYCYPDLRSDKFIYLDLWEAPRTVMASSFWVLQLPMLRGEGVGV